MEQHRRGSAQRARAKYRKHMTQRFKDDAVDAHGAIAYKIIKNQNALPISAVIDPLTNK